MGKHRNSWNFIVSWLDTVLLYYIVWFPGKPEQPKSEEPKEKSSQQNTFPLFERYLPYFYFTENLLNLGPRARLIQLAKHKTNKLFSISGGVKYTSTLFSP